MIPKKPESTVEIGTVGLSTVTRVTRGENIFNNKIYIGDLASM